MDETTGWYWQTFAVPGSDQVRSQFQNVWGAVSGSKCVDCGVVVNSFVEMADHRCEVSQKKFSEN